MTSVGSKQAETHEVNVDLGHEDNAIVGTGAHEHVIMLNYLLESDPSRRLATRVYLSVKSKDLHVYSVYFLKCLIFRLFNDLAQRDNISLYLYSAQFQVSKDFTNIVV